LLSANGIWKKSENQLKDYCVPNDCLSNARMLQRNAAKRSSVETGSNGQMKLELAVGVREDGYREILGVRDQGRH
jgi:hypothetical protein